MALVSVAAEAAAAASEVGDVEHLEDLVEAVPGDGAWLGLGCFLGSPGFLGSGRGIVDCFVRHRQGRFALFIFLHVVSPFSAALWTVGRNAKDPGGAGSFCGVLTFWNHYTGWPPNS